MTSGKLNTNSKGDKGETIPLNNDTLITLYVFCDKVTNHNHHTGLQISPDGGTTWMELPGTIKCHGVMTFKCVATHVRAFVDEPEGHDSEAEYFILTG